MYHQLSFLNMLLLTNLDLSPVLEGAGCKRSLTAVSENSF